MGLIPSSSFSFIVGLVPTGSGVPEKIIQERTGHRSLEALRTYERTTENQHKEVSTLLSVGSLKYSHSKEASTYQSGVLIRRVDLLLHFLLVNYMDAPSTLTHTNLFTQQTEDHHTFTSKTFCANLKLLYITNTLYNLATIVSYTSLNVSIYKTCKYMNIFCFTFME